MQSHFATRADEILIYSWRPDLPRFLPKIESGTSTKILLRARVIIYNSKQVLNSAINTLGRSVS